MGITFIALKCPSCGADISVEDSREVSFCSYCGSKIMMNNDNEHVYRNIDEAKIKEAETTRMIMMRQMDLEEKSRVGKQQLIKGWIICTAVLLFLGIIGISTRIEGLQMCMFIGICVGIWGGKRLLGTDLKREGAMHADLNEVVITKAMANYSEKNINCIVMLFKSAGFTNVTAIPMKDLGLFNQRKNGQVDAVTIDGMDTFKKGDIFPKSVNVLITYHSK